MMSETTKIQWCHHTFNHVEGCSKVSEGCANCYAEARADRFKTVQWGPQGTRRVTSEANWRQPLKWNREAEAAGERRRVFCASLADVFEDWKGPMKLSASAQGFESEAAICHGCGKWVRAAPMQDCGGCNVKCSRIPRKATMDDARNRLFRLIEDTPNLDWLLLTKRPENVLRMTYGEWCKPRPGHVSQNDGDGRKWKWPGNVWLGVSVEDQQRADERIPLLLQSPAAVRFLSVEPMLGPVSLVQSFNDGAIRNYLTGQFRGIRCKGLNGNPDFTAETVDERLPKVDWVIIGGESGPKARPCRVEWIRDLVRQCRQAGTACFVKQLGSNCQVHLAATSGGFPDGTVADPVGHEGWARVRLAEKGGDPSAWPEDLRVREFPQ